MTKKKNKFRKFFSAEQGLAAVEFALSLPLLIILTFGSVEVTIYILTTQKLERTSLTLSDLVSQSTTVTTTQLNQIISAAGQVMLPYSFANDGYAIISSVTKTGTSSPVVSWQYRSTGTAQTSRIGVSGGTATMPTNFTMVSGENVIITEVFYNYRPILTGTIYGSSQMYRYSIYKPRLGALTVLGFFSPSTQTARLICHS